MPADFLDDLNADIAAYDAAAQTQDNRYSGREGDTENLDVAVKPWWAPSTISTR